MFDQKPLLLVGRQRKGVGELIEVFDYPRLRQLRIVLRIEGLVRVCGFLAYHVFGGRLGVEGLPRVV